MTRQTKGMVSDQSCQHRGPGQREGASDKPTCLAIPLARPEARGLCPFRETGAQAAMVVSSSKCTGHGTTIVAVVFHRLPGLYSFGVRISPVTKPTVPKRRILVVDDEPLVCDAVKMMLSFDGHSVQTATSGTAALACLADEPFDLVIMDYAMPEMRGDELARRIKASHPALPVVMITAHAEMLASSGLPLPEIALVISKPFKLDTLREAIRVHCGPPSDPPPSPGAA